ncbi:MAG: hypothetical protein WC455_21325 [Dehalococcoidia bacterium]|jgi:hypothetical protein
MTVAELLAELAGQPMDRKVAILITFDDYAAHLTAGADEVVAEISMVMSDDQVNGEDCITLIASDEVLA